jgi:hypothetical protein
MLALTKGKFFLTGIIVILWSGSIFSQNPIVPPGVYIADPTARVWKDGKIYVYGSRDESPTYYCSWRYDILVSDDMKKWKLYPDRFSSKGEHDAVPYSDDLLYAPDCWYKEGKYYLYYCLANNTLTEGVAISDSPTGPFVDGTNIEAGKYHEIDPSVFVDDDGQGYYVWGQFNLKMAKLKPNMKEIDVFSVKENVLTEQEHFFHEGAFLTKRKGVYYLVYAHVGRAGRPTCIGYSTSTSPMGPYKYGGVIIDNDHCDPGNWNNHGSLVEYKGKWYVFYHRSTHGCKSMRKACIEPVYFNEDGSINEVEMTSQGAGEPLNSLDEIEAERACLLYGNVRIQAFLPTKEELGKIWNGDCAGYKYLDFGKGITRIKMRIAAGANPGKIDIAIDNSWGPTIGTIDVPGGGNLKNWQTFTCSVLPVDGIRALWFRFSGEGEDIFRIDRFQFEK